MKGSILSEPDLASVSSEMCQWIIREGQDYVDGQVKLAMSADTRATSLAALFAAADTALVAGLATVWSENLQDRQSICISLGIAATFFTAAAVLCVVSSFPVGIFLAGNQPANYYRDIADKKSFENCLRGEVLAIQKKIAENSITLKRNATLFRCGVFLGIISPIAGLITWGLLKLL